MPQIKVLISYLHPRLNSKSSSTPNSGFIRLYYLFVCVYIIYIYVGI